MIDLWKTHPHFAAAIEAGLHELERQGALPSSCARCGSYDMNKRRDRCRQCGLDQ